MTVFDRLRGAMEKAQAEQELPDHLAQGISAILERQKEFAGREKELDDLIDKVTMYDTYGQTGYLGMGVNNAILQKALEQLLALEQIKPQR